MITELNMADISIKDQDWWLDSGATIHICNDKNKFKNYVQLTQPEEVLMGDHVIAKVQGKGTVELNSLQDKSLHY